MLAYTYSIDLCVEASPKQHTKKAAKQKNILIEFANIFTLSQPFIEPLAENKTTRMLTKKKRFLCTNDYTYMIKYLKIYL